MSIIINYTRTVTHQSNIKNPALLPEMTCCVSGTLNSLTPSLARSLFLNTSPNSQKKLRRADVEQVAWCRNV